MYLNTILYIFSFFFIFFSILGYGLILSHTININNRRSISFGIFGLLGVFLYTLISYSTHLFFAHNLIHNLIVNLIGIILFLYFYIKNFFFYKKEFFKLLILILFFLPGLFLSKNNEDFPYYHLPYMMNLVEHKLQFGIAHFNIAFRTPSSLFYAQSLFYLPVVKQYLFHSLSLIILIFSNLFLIDNYLFKKKNSNFLIILSSLIFVFINLVFWRLAEHGTDKAGQIIVFVMIILLLDCINNKKFIIEKIKITIILLIYLLSVKAYFASYTLLLPLILFIILKSKNFLKIICDLKFICIIILYLLMFLFINFTNSGCLIYPLKFSCIETMIWSVTKASVEDYNQWYELWSKAGATPNSQVSNPEEYLKSFNWVSNWIKNYFYTKITDALGIIIAICLIFFLFIKNKISQNKKNNKYFFLYSFIIFLFLVWFNKHPDLRYGGYVLLALLFFIPLSSYLSVYIKNKNNFIILITFFIIATYGSRNVLRVYNEFNSSRPDMNRYKSFPFFHIEEVSYSIIYLKNNIKIFITNNNKMCWITPSPCVSEKINGDLINSYNFFYTLNK
jgi:hypothetical protein